MTRAPYMPELQEVVDYVASFIVEVGWPPSRREIASHFGISLSTAQGLMIEARKAGLISIGTGARQVRVNQMKQLEDEGTRF